MAACDSPSESRLLRKTLSTLAKWIPHPNPADALGRPAVSWVVAEQWTGGLASCQGVANRTTQVGDENRGQMWSVSRAGVPAAVSPADGDGETVGANQGEGLSLQKTAAGGMVQPKAEAGP